MTSEANDRLIILGTSASALGVARDAASAGLECAIVDREPGPASHSRVVCMFELVSTEAEAEAAIIRLAMGPRAHLIADSDEWLRFILARYALFTSHLNVLHPSAGVIDTCLDKRKFQAWCANEKFPTPHMYQLADLDQAQYPLLVRPAQTRHSQRDLPKAFVAKARGDLDQCLRGFRDKGVEPIISQSLIGDDSQQFSVAVCRRSDGRLLTFVAEKRRPTADKCAGGSLVVEVRSSAAQRLAEEVVERMDFVGIGELEIMGFDGNLYLIELNARPWLQYGLPRVAGLSFIEFLLKGRPQASRESRMHSWLALKGDMYWCFSRSEGLVWNKGVTFAEVIASVLRADCHPVWSWTDPGPFVLPRVARLTGRRTRAPTKRIATP